MRDPTYIDLGRAEPWAKIRGLRALGNTVLLTTHYMEEAQRLPARGVRIFGDTRNDRCGMVGVESLMFDAKIETNDIAVFYHCIIDARG